MRLLIFSLRGLDNRWHRIIARATLLNTIAWVIEHAQAGMNLSEIQRQLVLA